MRGETKKESTLEDNFLIERLQSSKKYMNYGLSGRKEENTKNEENLITRIKESQNTVDLIYGVIENLASENKINSNTKGYNKKRVNLNSKKTIGRKSNYLIIFIFSRKKILF